MSILATLSPEQRRQFTRMETTTITRHPDPTEVGFSTWGRDTAEAVREALRGTEWQAEARAPYWPHAENETHGQLIIAVKIDHRWLRIVHTHTVPNHTDRDLFTLTIDGRPARYALHRGDLPHMPAMIALTAWRNISRATFGECAALMCDESPTVATYNATLCEEHARSYADTGRY